MSVADIAKRVGTLFDDPAGDRFDKDDVLAWLAIENENVETILENLDLSYDTAVIVLQNVAANTTDLSAFQADGQILQNMMYPIALEWRLVGQNDLQWNPVGRVDKLIDTNTGADGDPVTSSVAGISSWTVTGGIVGISPSSQPVDIRVRAENLPALLDVDSAAYIKGMTNVLVYRVAAAMAVSSSGSGASKQAVTWNAKGDEIFEAVQDRLAKEEQVTPRRMGGRRSGFNGPLWRTPTG